MAIKRRAVIRPRFESDVKSLGIVGGTEAAIALAKAMDALTVEEKLPAPGDAEALVPPTLWFYVRAVGPYWLWYEPLGTSAVAFVRLMSTAPATTRRR